MVELEEEILKGSGIKALPLVVVHRRYLFHFGGNMEKKAYRNFDVHNKKQPTIKITAEWPKTQVNFLNVTVSLENGNSKTDLNVKSTDAH